MNISDWLRSIGMEIYEDNFVSNEITFEDLAELSGEELKEDLGIKPLGHRKKILNAIANIQSVDDDDEKIIQFYPYSIAYPFKQMLDEKNGFQKIQIMKDVFLNLLKYLGLLAATEYFFSDKKSKMITNLFRDKLYQPHFGNWNHFIRETLSFLDIEGHTFLVHEIPAFYKNVETGKKSRKYKLESHFTDEMGDVQTVFREFTAIGGLINFRNRFIGHGVTLSQQKSEILYNIYYPILKELLVTMEFLPKYPLFKVCKGKRVRLMGIQPKEEGIDPGLISKSCSLWIETPNGQQQPLVPFYISPEQYLADVSENIQLFIYEQYTSKRIIYFSPEQETGETSGEPVRLLNEMIKNKTRLDPVELNDLSEEMFETALNDESNTTIEELSREQKIIAGIYQSREDNEQSIRSFVSSPKPLYFLAAEAGSGKTNLMAEMYRQLSGDGKKVLLLKALRLSDSKMTDILKMVLNLKDIEGLESSELFNRKSSDPLIILLDGCNEHKEPEKLFSSCIELTNLLTKGSIKVVVSWRINSPKDYPQINHEMDHLLFDAGGESRPDTEGNPLVSNAAILKPLNKVEVAGAWKQYQKDRQKRFLTMFSFEDLELKDREFTERLRNPLLLRLFLELNRGKALSKKKKAILIWPEWYKSIEKQIPGSNKFMMDLIREIYDKEEIILDIDSLFDHPKLRSFIRQLNIDSPYRRLLARGVLSQYFRHGFLTLTFTVEGAYHYVLYRFIKEEIGYDSGRELIEIIIRKKGLKGIREAVGYCLLNEMLEGSIDHLSEFIKCGGEYLHVVSVPLAAAIRYIDHETLLDKLLTGDTENAIKAILIADFILERNLFHEIRYNLFKVLLSRNEITDTTDELVAQIYHRFNLICHEHGKYEESLQYAIKLFEVRKQISTNMSLEMATAFNRMAVAYRKLMRNTDPANVEDYGNKALEYEHKALNIRKKILGPGHLDIARSYDNLEKIYEYRAEWKEAVQYGIKLIELYETYFDPWYPLLAAAYNNTAIVLREDMQKEKSIDFSNKALNIVEKSLGEMHIEMAYANWTLSNTYLKFGNREMALNCMNKTVSILEKLLVPDHPNMLMAYEVRDNLQ